MTTLLFEERVTEVPEAQVRGDDLWVPRDALEGATGWSLKPEGVCRGAVCVAPPLEGRDSWDDGERFDVSAFARWQRRPSVRDVERDVWSIGPAPGSSLDATEAPDFTLSDFDGRPHALSDYRGRKVLLLAWASW